MNQSDFETIVGRAILAPSVHNTQPARFRLDGDTILVGCDLGTSLPVGDPEGRDAGLSCGTATEAAVLALADLGLATSVSDRWADDDSTTVPGTRLAAHIEIAGQGSPDALATSLETRFTFRGKFSAPSPDVLAGWSPPDTMLVNDVQGKAWVAKANDRISLATMRLNPVRAELLHWMRLSKSHPRYAYDGMNRDALRMPALVAFGAGLTLGPLWGLCDLLGLTGSMTAEADATVTAATIACFHRPVDESPVTTGRAYLRLCLAAAARGMAGWPMAALADDPTTRAEIATKFGIGADRRLVQVIRFGIPTATMQPRARRPLAEVII